MKEGKQARKERKKGKKEIKERKKERTIERKACDGTLRGFNGKVSRAVTKATSSTWYLLSASTLYVFRIRIVNCTSFTKAAPASPKNSPGSEKSQPIETDIN
jgi:hypothetical protein